MAWLRFEAPGGVAYVNEDAIGGFKPSNTNDVVTVFITENKSFEATIASLEVIVTFQALITRIQSEAA